MKRDIIFSDRGQPSNGLNTSYRVLGHISAWCLFSALLVHCCCLTCLLRCRKDFAEILHQFIGLIRLLLLFTPNQPQGYQGNPADAVLE